MKLEHFLHQSMQDINKPKRLLSDRLREYSQAVYEVVCATLSVPFKIFSPSLIKDMVKKDGYIIGMFYYFCILGIAIGTIDFIYLHIFIPLRSTVLKDVIYIDNFLSVILFVILFIILFWLLVLLPTIFYTIYDKDIRHLVKWYKKIGGGQISFTSEQYEKAAKVLRNFKKTSYSNAKDKFGEDIIHLLLIGGGLFMEREKDGLFSKKKMVKRLVSIKSIENDTEPEE